MKFVYDGKFYLVLDNNVHYEVSEQVWLMLMSQAKKEKFA